MTRLVGLVLRSRRRPGRHALFDAGGHPDPSPQALALADAVEEAERAERFGADWHRSYPRGLFL